MTMTITVASLRRGDIVLVLFPDSNLRTAKLRPAVVIQAENLNTGLPQVILAMVTSRVDRAGHPSRVLLSRRDPTWLKSELLKDSVVMTDNLATVHEVEIDRHIGAVPTAAIDAALRYTLGL